MRAEVRNSRSATRQGKPLFDVHYAHDWPEQTRLCGFVGVLDGDKATLPTALEAFLASGEPPVVFTSGTAMTQAHRFFEVSVRAVQDLNRRAILLTSHTEQLLRTFPATVLPVDYYLWPNYSRAVRPWFTMGVLGPVPRVSPRAYPKLSFRAPSSSRIMRLVWRALAWASPSHQRLHWSTPWVPKPLAADPLAQGTP